MIGILGLDTRFTKPVGHIRNPATFDFDVVYKVVSGATPARVVLESDPALTQPFVEAAQGLEREGVAAITSACGFLAVIQPELADAVDVPLYSSSLIQVPMVQRMLSRYQKVGILVASKRSLTPKLLGNVGIEPSSIGVIGMDDQAEFQAVIIEGRRDNLDTTALCTETLNACDTLMTQHQDIGAIVIECTDLCLFSNRIRQHTGRPVFDIITLTNMVRSCVT